MISITRPEDRLLICVARRSMDVAMSERMRSLLRLDLDWRYLLARADRHGVVPLLHYHLKSTAAEAVPPHVMSQLRSDNEKNTKQSLFLTGELIKLLDFLGGHGIHAIPFKGPTLALLVYGDVALRQFADLDILVDRQDVARVKELLVSRGFRAEPELTSEQQSALLRFDCAYNFDNEQGVLLDLHWKFVPRYFSLDLDIDRLWDRLQSMSIGRREVPTLSSEDLLLTLCLHGFTHAWERLGWICDVASLIDDRRIDWEFVLNNAAQLGCQRILFLGLLMASELLEAPIPEDVLKVIKSDRTAVAVANRFQEHFFVRTDASPGLFEDAFLHLRMREQMQDKLRSCLRLATTPRVFDWMYISVPDQLFFLYYPLRPIRLVGKYGAKLLRGSANQRVFDRRSVKEHS